MTGKAIAYLSRSQSLGLVEAPEVSEPNEAHVLVRTELVGFCGTDREIVQGGIAVPVEDDHLILGHEMVGVVSEVGPSVDGLSPGDRVVPVVRLPCGQCRPCEVGRSDFCLTGDYREYGITRLHGFARPFVPVPAVALLKVPDGLGEHAVLAEPLSIVEKTVDEARYALSRIPGRPLEGDRWGAGLRALVTGAGSIGILSVYLLDDLGFEVEVVDVRPSDGLSARLAKAAGASYLDVERGEPPESVIDRVGRADLVIEATGNPGLAFALLDALAPGGVLMWVGVAAEEQIVKVEASKVVLNAVLGHNAVIGTVNSGLPFLEKALQDLVRLYEKPGFSEILTGILPVEDFEEAIWPKREAIKQAVSYREVDSWR